MNANTNAPHELIQTLDKKYQFTPYLMLRGHIAFKAALQMGQYLAKTGAFSNDIYDARGEEHEAKLMEEAGMEVNTTEQWYDDICALVRYANRLTFDMQALVDPTELKRLEPSFKEIGVWFNENQRRDNWRDTIRLVAAGQEDQPIETYAQYVAQYTGDANDKLTQLQWTEEQYDAYVKRMDNPAWAMSKPSWLAIFEAHESMYTKHEFRILEALLDIGYDEGDFDELSVRNQIAFIENTRTKLDRMADSAAKSVRFTRGLTLKQKEDEASTISGLIRHLDKDLCAMLESSRYANYAEFMKSYIPGVQASPIISRKMIAKQEQSEIDKFLKGKLSPEGEAMVNTDALEDLVSDTV